MNPTYNLQWLLDKYDQGNELKYLFFWGHTAKPGQEVGSFCFSQWYPSPFTVDGVTYRTAEHWMMGQKALLFNDTAVFNKIIDADTPGKVKALGREVTGFDETVWNEKRWEIVLNGNIHKFKQDPKLTGYLLGTGDQILVEASPTDRIWGIGLAKDAKDIENPHSWKGENLLGFVLMATRDALRGDTQSA